MEGALSRVVGVFITPIVCMQFQHEIKSMI